MTIRKKTLGKKTFISAFVFTKNKNIKINKYTAPLSSDTGTYCFYLYYQNYRLSMLV